MTSVSAHRRAGAPSIALAWELAVCERGARLTHAAEMMLQTASNVQTSRCMTISLIWAGFGARVRMSSPSAARAAADCSFAVLEAIAAP